jgi:hypothetical protein
MSSAQTIDMREWLRLKWRDAFDDGARRGFAGKSDYPAGFHDWPLGKRNAWFAGYNVGLLDAQKWEARDGNAA